MHVSQRPWAAAGGEAAASGRGAQDLSVVATFTMEPDGRVSSWSAAAGRLLGHQAQQILGRPVPPAPRATGTAQPIAFRLEPWTCAGPPQVAVTASPPVPAGQQMLIDAGLRFGATLDLTETAHQLVDVTVPRFADACAVYVLERPASGGELTGPEAGIEVVARQLATGAARGTGPAAAE